MAGAWGNVLGFPALYLAAKDQPWRVPYHLPDLCAAESAVAHMGWDEILAQPHLLGQPDLRYVDFASARFIFRTTPAGTIRAHGFRFHPGN